MIRVLAREWKTRVRRVLLAPARIPALDLDTGATPEQWGGTSRNSNTNGQFRWARWSLTLAVFMTIWGSHCAVIDRYGSDLPMWDQWDGVAMRVFVPYFEGHLSWRNFVIPHNEHRIASTRALALGLLIGNGQWDARLECIVNAAIHAALAAALFLAGSSLLLWPWRGLWFLAVVALIAPPMSWHNILSAFHSQQILLLVFSIVTIALLLRTRPLRGGWWCGTAVGAIALFTMASGFLAAAAVFGILLFDGPPPHLIRRHGWTLLACGGLVAAGLAMQIKAPHDPPLHAPSISVGALAFWRSLQWPAVTQPWYPIIGWLPWAWLALRLVYHRSLDAREKLFLGIGLFVILQFLATAYARGAGAHWPASRYLDTLTIGIVVNVFAALRFFSCRSLRVWQAGAVGGLGIAACLALVNGFRPHIQSTLASVLPDVRKVVDRREATTRAFLLTGNPHELENRDIQDLAYPNAGLLLALLEHEDLRAILPASVRPPIQLRGTSHPPESFAPSGVPPELERGDLLPVIGSYTQDGAAALGTFRSEVITPTPFKFWAWDLAGNNSPISMELELESPEGATLQKLSTMPDSTSSWTALLRPAPRVPCVVTARDGSSSDWLAFGGPTEMATGSYYASRLASRGMGTAIAGLALAIATTGREWIRRLLLIRKEPAASTKGP